MIVQDCWFWCDSGVVYFGWSSHEDRRLGWDDRPPSPWRMAACSAVWRICPGFKAVAGVNPCKARDVRHEHIYRVTSGHTHLASHVHNTYYWSAISTCYIYCLLYNLFTLLFDYSSASRCWNRCCRRLRRCCCCCCCCCCCFCRQP